MEDSSLGTSVSRFPTSAVLGGINVPSTQAESHLMASAVGLSNLPNGSTPLQSAPVHRGDARPGSDRLEHLLLDVEPELSGDGNVSLSRCDTTSSAGDSVPSSRRSPCNFASPLARCNRGKGKVVRLKAEQTEVLEARFQERCYVDAAAKAALARELGLTPKQVAIWYQNKRARMKQRQQEKDGAAPPQWKSDQPGPWQEVDDPLADLSAAAAAGYVSPMGSTTPGSHSGPILGGLSPVGPTSSAGSSKRKLPGAGAVIPEDLAWDEDELQFSGPVKKTQFGAQDARARRPLFRSLSKETGSAIPTLDELLDDATDCILSATFDDVKPEFDIREGKPLTTSHVPTPLPPAPVPLALPEDPVVLTIPLGPAPRLVAEKEKRLSPGSPAMLFGRKAFGQSPGAPTEDGQGLPLPLLNNHPFKLSNILRRATSRNQGQVQGLGPSPGQPKLALEQAKKILYAESPAHKKEKEDILTSMKGLSIAHLPEEIKLTPTPRSWKSPESLMKWMESLK